MLSALSAVLVLFLLPQRLLAADVAEESTSELASAVRECLITLSAFATFVFLFSLRQRSTKKSVKRCDKLGYERPATQRAPTGMERMGKESNKNAISEVSRTVAEHVRLTELVHSLAKEGENLKAAVTMKMLEDRCGTPGLPEYNALITMCSKSNDVQGALLWMNRLKEKGHTPNVVSFNAMINAHAKLGDMSKAVAVAEEMRGAGVNYDVVTYNTIIDACTRKGDAVGAQDWMKKMLSAGVNPSVVSFCSVMRACAKAGLNDDLGYWIEEANTLGIQLNMICFSAVMNAFAQNGDLTSAEHCLTRMTHCNVSPSVHCFMGMVDAVCKSGDVESAARIVGMMREVRVWPDVRMYSALLRAACHAGKFEYAQNWINEAAEEGTLSGIRLARLIPASFAAKLTIPSDVNSGKASSNRVAAEAPAKSEVDQYDAASLEGKQLVGTVKEFIPGKFGYIFCDESYAVFKRDVFVSNQDNPEQFAKGQMVSFVLQIDRRRGLPRACELKVFQK